MLRKWQAECVDVAIEHYKTKKNFLALATPAAGKTIMAAEVAFILFENRLIDFVICFSPSTNVANSIQSTFSRRLNREFKGGMGDVGCSYTYQSMRHFNDAFWQIIRNNRVFVVFDEIHHCAGNSLKEANAWGEDIILNIQQQASFTLALTGTPWRSDLLPITLAKYSDPANNIQCDYTYSLRQAITDGVCRKPSIVLVDNDEIKITSNEEETKIFNSLCDALKGGMISYKDVITNETVMRYIINLSCKKLDEIRNTNPGAGGLIVASSVEHAHEILQIITNDFGQSAIIVNYKEIEPSQKIDKFRSCETQWVVSVGMIAEGTDIPRLQVCCHLSRVKTELYFRQILGRILRVSNAINQDAWLFTLAEKSLTTFAKRISQELPDFDVLIKNKALTNSYFSEKTEKKTSNNPQPKNDMVIMSELSSSEFEALSAQKNNECISASIQSFGGFRKKLINTFTH